MILTIITIMFSEKINEAGEIFPISELQEREKNKNFFEREIFFCSSSSSTNTSE